MGDKVSPFKKIGIEAYRNEMFTVRPEDLVMPGETKEGKAHVLYDPREHTLPVDRRLVAVMKSQGSWDPITLQRMPDDSVVVADGRQRTKAGRQANIELLAEGKEPILVRVVVEKTDMDDPAELERTHGIMISSGAIRQDDDPRLKGKKAKQLMDRFGYPVAKVAHMFGVSPATIKQWVGLDDAPKDVQAALDANLVTPTAAAKLAKLPDLDRAAAIGEIKEKHERGESTTVAALAQAAKAKKSGNDDVALVRPSVRDGRRVVESEAAKEALHPEFIKGVRWMIGDLRTERVGGLKAIVDG